MEELLRNAIESAVASSKERKFTDFCLAIVGPGGTGKTAVLKMAEALTVFFAGPDTMRKLAPSNAAARLLGGDTLHSLCKIPYGGARLTSKKRTPHKTNLACSSQDLGTCHSSLLGRNFHDFIGPVPAM